MGNLLSWIRGLVAAKKTPASSLSNVSSAQQETSIFNLKGLGSSKSGKPNNKYEYIPDNYSSLDQVRSSWRPITIST